MAPLQTFRRWSLVTVMGLSAAIPTAAEGSLFKLEGYVKLDAAYDDSRVNPGNFARWVESEGILDDDSQFSMTANQTRLALAFQGPAHEGMTTRGRVEIDFYGGGAENKSNPLLRHAWFAFSWPQRQLEVLAGQTSDIISPLVVPTVNYSAGWWQGNLGYRRAQLRVTKTWGAVERPRFVLSAGPSRTITDSTFVIGPIDSGTDAAVPTLQARAGWSVPLGAGRTFDAGVSGHFGKEDQHMTDASGTIVGHRHVDSWSLNLDVKWSLGESWRLQAEAFRGENLASYLGGIGQKGEFASQGGWIAVTLKLLPRWTLNAGAGIDDPDDDALTDPAARIRNGMVFANANLALSPQLTLSLESMWMETRYLALPAGDGWRQQFAATYTF